MRLFEFPGVPLKLEEARIAGLTEIGAVTAGLLRMNEDERILERRLLQLLGEYPER